MIAMSMLSAYDDPVRHAMLHVLSRVGLDLGGVAAVDDDVTLGVG